MHVGSLHFILFILFFWLGEGGGGLAGQIGEFWQQTFDVLLQVMFCLKEETAVSVNGVLLKEVKDIS